MEPFRAFLKIVGVALLSDYDTKPQEIEFSLPFYRQFCLYLGGQMGGRAPLHIIAEGQFYGGLADNDNGVTRGPR